MKKIFSNIFSAAIAAAMAFSFTGCHYLDVDPELGITEEEVFSTYSNANSFLSMAYDANSGNNKINISLAYPMYMEFLQDFYLSWAATTDAADAGKLGYAQRNFKQGYLSQDIIKQYSLSNEQADKPIATAMFGVIRVANKLIEQFPNIKNGTEKELNDLLGQAYFLRGLCHFNLCRYFGGMPYIDYVIGADDSWDLPRESSYETYTKAAADLQIAYEHFAKAGIMRRNTPENLNPGKVALMYPNGCIALAVRARALLYAASPLSNQNGTADWEAAAEAAGQALQAAIDNRYELLPIEYYTTNHTGGATTNEILWGYYISQAANVQNMAGLLSQCQSDYSGKKGASGLHPTQNFVDRFETADGYLLRTEADRQKAAAAGSYNEQNPYANRDPRMDLVIIHDGSPAFDKAAISSAGEVFNIYYDPATKTYPVTNLNGKNMSYGIDWGSGDSDTKGASNTGYYCRRHWDGGFTKYYQLDAMYRLGEMYLAYAEAVNEAYGPHGSAGGMALTALEAVNAVRERVGMPEVRAEYCADKDTFRDYIRNERCVEVAFESNHYYFDIRRWKEAPVLMNQTLYGMYIEKCTPSATYPNGKMYVRKPLPNNRQCLWRDYMYVLPFPDKQANTMQNFVNNQKWQ